MLTGQGDSEQASSAADVPILCFIEDTYSGCLLGNFDQSSVCCVNDGASKPPQSKPYMGEGELNLGRPLEPGITAAYLYNVMVTKGIC